MTSNGNRSNKRSSGRKNSVSSGKNSGSSRRSSSSSRSRNNSRSTSVNRNNNQRKRTNTSEKKEEFEFDYVKTLIYIGVFAVLILMFLFALEIFDGGFGRFVTGVIKGLFGFNSYVIPIIGIATVIYYIFADFTKKSVFNIISAAALVIGTGMLAHLTYKDISAFSYLESVKLFFHEGKGGGVIFGTLAYLIDKSCGRALVWILPIVLIIAAITVMFGNYIVRFTVMLINKYSDLDDEDPEKQELTRREIRKLREKQEAAKQKKISYKITQDDESSDTEKKENENKPKVIDVDPSDMRLVFNDGMDDENEEDLPKPKKEVREVKETNDIHQIDSKHLAKKQNEDEIRPINVYSDDKTASVPAKGSFFDKDIKEVNSLSSADNDTDESTMIPEPVKSETVSLTGNSVKMLENSDHPTKTVSDDPSLDSYKTKEKKSSKAYKFPPVGLLKKSEKNSKSKGDNIYETANKLKETLATFGVEVYIDPDNCSKGPSVTRYELTPAPGVKVSRIVSLSDDIKLSLGTADIRIEAPIPGKSAVGIEVPNSESSAVPFRDLVESNEFNSAKSKLSIAIGKDLAGQSVIADIAKMPHLLIAGATGSGKSVCINTIIMSILYKAHPDEVKLILIDPKVVELSVYNNIPHLLLPVVTDPKLAAGSLHWGVSEMEKRYKLFADLGVRDLKGYNEKISEEDEKSRLPQIVIIVDELADLMMVAGKEVEESICRLAQLARAAGIHIIIATQRPSVDVITGLIKANMPSRIAFSVSSGIDSRTILDTNGAEKLLGKGDMLFFPQGMNKPSRVQGCFVSDDEVSNVVDFIRNQNISGYDERIMNDMNSASGPSQTGGSNDDNDALFNEAALFIIGKEKASIGALQRAFKIGFNRAARIMDQLEASGVVGPEEGTKPRKILMSEAEFNQMIGK
ncbi:MAG: DNA translocase FtsK [Lachnospiraceae bacterium]|nr:DNA translocase FtsK [Lachnospiraceae bacterium]